MSATDAGRREFVRAGIWSTGAIAGAAGGVIEIAWIALYQGLTGGQGDAVARGVTQSLIPQLASSSAGALLGVAIHMTLAVMLGVLIAYSVRRFLPRVAGSAWEPVTVVAMLVGVWAVNFFVILPVINPAFVAIVPYGASFVSKVLFGFAAAFTFRWAARRHAAS